MSAGPAAAHIEVFTDAPVQAGTGPVTLHFMAESESPTVGIVSVKTQLPQGIAPEIVSLASAPEGWTMTLFAEGFELGGPSVAAGVEADCSVQSRYYPLMSPNCRSRPCSATRTARKTPGGSSPVKRHQSRRCPRQY